jgi:hypothetical protein
MLAGEPLWTKATATLLTAYDPSLG